MTTLFLLVRHAAHDLVGRVLTGRMPGVNLGEEGRAQAQALAGRLAQEKIAALYTSPMERARETAEPIAGRLGLAAGIAPGLDEIDMGEWTGRRFDELDSDPRWATWNAARGTARTPGGESMVEVQSRALAELHRLRAKHVDETVAIVSHADVIKAVVAACLGLSLDAILRFEVSPATVSRVLLGDWGARVWSVNEAVAP